MPRLGSTCILLLLLAALANGQTAVLTQYNDNNRTGQNPNETTLNTANVNVANFGKLFSLAVDGYIYAQPLYVSNLNIGGRQRNVVFVATEHNSVFAFDADDPSAILLWQASLGPTVPSTDICGGTPGCYADLVPEIGITSTPVIDRTANLLYVVAKNKDADGSYHFRLHALNLFTGGEMLGGPVGVIASGFLPLQQLNRPGLLLANRTLYLAFGSLGDTPPWSGWVMAYNPQTLQQTAVLNTSPGGSGGSLWAGGRGLAADSTGHVYAVTANGPFDVNTGGSDYGDSALKLDGSSLAVLDYFTPYNQALLAGSEDLDLGGGGALLLPGTTLLLCGGKDGMLRLIDTANMGKFNGGFNADVQEWQATTGTMMGGPAYWNSPTRGPLAYLWGPGDVLNAWSFNGQTFASTPVSQGTIQTPTGTSNTAALAISSNGSTPGAGIVWALTPLSGDANLATVPGVLRAFDADNLANELWDSLQNAARDGVGTFAKFNPPTVAGGKVYVPTFSGQLQVYGLLVPADFSVSVTPRSATVVAGSTAAYQVNVSSVAGFSGTVNLGCVLPQGARLTCSLSSASVIPGAGPVTLTVATIGKSAALGNTWRLLAGFLPLWLLLPAASLGTVSFGRFRSSMRLATLGAISLLLLFASCGGGGSSAPPTGSTGTPPGTYNLQVTASSGTLSHPATITLDVQ